MTLFPPAFRALVPVLAAVLLPEPSHTAEPPEEAWVEVRSPHFVVVSNASEKQARRVAGEFEQFRAVFGSGFPNERLDPCEPLIILAARDEQTLRALLPGFWEQAGHTHPSGILVMGQEKYYAAVRLDRAGPNPYHHVYHEYVHLLNRLNFDRLPLWLNEGLAELYANTVIGPRTVELGRPDESHLRLLRTQSLLPLDVLFAADPSSPHYNEAGKASLFYAQAWVLAHYLTFGDGQVHQGELDRFLRLLAQGEDQVVAAREAFGDLQQLESRLGEYARQPAFGHLTVEAHPQIEEKDFPARVLSAAESAVVRADFLLHTQRPAEARALLREALQLDSQLAATYEALGFLSMQEGQRAEAARWLEKAVELGSESYLAHYFFGVVTAEISSSPENLERAEEHCERAIELNPRFAPAYAALSGFYAARPATRKQALPLARKAVELDPGNLEFRLHLGHILLALQQPDEAVQTGEEALAAAGSAQRRKAAQEFLDTARQYQRELAEWKRAEETARAERLAASQTTPPSGGKPEPAAPLPPRADAGAIPRRVIGSAVEGWIAAVSCKGKTMNLRLNLGPYNLLLRSSDYFQLGFLTTNWQPPANFDPCLHLRGARATVIYRAVEGKAYAGEILSVELHK